MISQRMGFHYGDNVQLPGEGAYTVRVTVNPVTGINRTGSFEGRLESPGSLEIDFEYARSDIHDLSFKTIPEDRRGSREALSLMSHGGDGGGDGNGGHSDGAGQPPMGRGVPIEDLPGQVFEPQRSGDATFAALVSDADRFTDGSSYLAISPERRTTTFSSRLRPCPRPSRAAVRSARTNSWKRSITRSVTTTGSRSTISQPATA